MGILFAWLWVRYNALFVIKRFVWDFTTLFAIIGLFYFYKPQDDWTRNLVFNVSVFFLFFGFFKGRLFNRLANVQWLALIGGMCYSLYLFHLGSFHFFVPILMDLFGPMHYHKALIVTSFTAIPLAIVFCSIIYLLIEKPTMDPLWPHKLFKFIAGKKTSR